MRIKDHELNLITKLLVENPEGLSASAILALMQNPIERRTLIRRLNELQQKQIIVRENRGKNALYKVSHFTKQSSGELIFSKEAINIQNAVNQPLEKRPRIGYHQPFLETYRPNHSPYLTESERNHLEALGANQNGHLPAGTFARKILDRFLIDLSWNSSRLEGNTYSLLETEQLIHQGEANRNKTPIETQMILNHKSAIEFLVDPNYEIALNKFTICNLHALLSDNLMMNPEACGRIRKIAVMIGGSSYSPLDIPQQIEETLEVLLKKASQIKNVFEQAFFLMVHLPYLQPFEDVNKRVSRLSTNIPFITQNYCPISFVDVPEKTYIEGLLGVYELNRVSLLKDVFIWAYSRSTNRYAEIRQTVGEPDPFRLRYRSQIYEAIHQIVSGNLSKSKAIENLRLYATQHIPKDDQAKFIESVETELLALHEGNFARYKITPNEFKQWQAAH